MTRRPPEATGSTSRGIALSSTGMEEPRSRKSAQAATRERLVEVATDILLDSGYGATSLDRIAEAAGYSKGAVYSNFSGKEELVLEVLDRRFSNRLVDLAALVAEADETPEARVDAFVGWWERMLVDEGWGVVVFEFVGATRDNAELQQMFAERQTMVIAYCAALLQAEIDRFDLTPTMSARELGGLLVALGQGLSFTRSLVPEVSAQLLVKTTRLVLLGESGR